MNKAHRIGHKFVLCYLHSILRSFRENYLSKLLLFSQQYLSQQRYTICTFKESSTIDIISLVQPTFHILIVKYIRYLEVVCVLPFIQSSKQ